MKMFIFAVLVALAAAAPAPNPAAKPGYLAPLSYNNPLTYNYVPLQYNNPYSSYAPYYQNYYTAPLSNYNYEYPLTQYLF